MRVGGLELGVEVHPPVDRIREAVQALAGVHVAALGDDLENVLILEIGQPDPIRLAVGRRFDRPPVQGDRTDLVGDQIDERGGAGLAAAEAHRCGRQEVIRFCGPRREVEGNFRLESGHRICLARDRADEARPFGRLVTAQVVTWHRSGAFLSIRAVQRSSHDLVGRCQTHPVGVSGAARVGDSASCVSTWAATTRGSS
jgi:hypothetical protein